MYLLNYEHISKSSTAEITGRLLVLAPLFSKTYILSVRSPQ